ncbi:MAG: hypothetical protein IKY09_02640 [Methanocorpusculum sp.]|nr:hypothetical protein [Methanocorpusculum sp.]MBR5451034.1 hypothetical protein [Methanocorpusculum sp.]
MAIDIFKIIKADRYTQDGRDEINKALNETEDAGLPDGTIRHRKDGDYIKQGGQWKPAPARKAPGAKTGPGTAPAAGSKPAKSKPAGNTSWSDAKVGLVNQAGVSLSLNAITFGMTPAWAEKHGYSKDDVNGTAAQVKLANQIIKNQDWSNPEATVKKINDMGFGYTNWKVTENQGDKVKIASKDSMGNTRELTIKKLQSAPAPATSTESKPSDAPKFKSRNTIMMEKNGFKEVEKGGSHPKLPRFQYKSKSGKTYNVYRDIGGDGYFYHVQTPGGFTKTMKDVSEIKKYLDSDGGNWGHAPDPRGLLRSPYTEKDLVKSNNDAAPKALTGDSKIRVRKSK